MLLCLDNMFIVNVLSNKMLSYRHLELVSRSALHFFTKILKRVQYDDKLKTIH